MRSQSSQNVIFLRFCEVTILTPYFSVIFHKTHREHEQNETCKKVNPKKILSAPFQPQRKPDRVGQPANYSASRSRLKGKQRHVQWGRVK